MEKPTDVIFRKFKDGDVIALFPTLIGTNSVYTCLNYMHVGQHGTGQASIIDTYPVTESEYEPLAKELQSIGYVLNIRKRFSYADISKRAQQLGS